MNSNPLAGLYKLARPDRLQKLAAYANLTSQELEALAEGLTIDQADLMIENVVGRYALPLGLATNFVIDERPVIVPLVVEEPSIVAGASYAAKLAQAGGGFKTGSSEPLMIGQVQVLELTNLPAAAERLLAAQDELLSAANQHHPTIQALGGGAKAIECRLLEKTPAGPMLILHLLYDCRDAMGANAVNTAAEAIAPLVEQISGGRVNLRILSNLTDRRTAWAECWVPVAQLSRGEMAGWQVARAIFEAWALAAADPYRAATHNKGIMNGIDAVALATGNDWRALEAGAHAYAARSGRYASLSEWSLVEARQPFSPDFRRLTVETAQATTHLRGRLETPLSVGTVGGATRAHPTARATLKILGQPDARTLAEIMVSVGLAQNLAALRALATEGIQQGHMQLHARQVALAAGAQENQVHQITRRLVSEGTIRVERAKQLLQELE